jgi:hypothetical protein
MKKTLFIAATFLAAVLASSANAAPLGGVIGGGVSDDSIVEKAQHAYGYVCSYGPRGWYSRTRRGELVSCRPRRPLGFGWSWYTEGGRSGWYHSRDRRWHHHR